MIDQPNKNYGNLTLDQFKQLVGELPEIRCQMKAFPELINSMSKDNIKKVLGSDVYWAATYESSFQELLALFVCALGCHEKLHDAVQSDHKIEATFNLFQDVEFDNWQGGLNGWFSINDVVALFTALQRNILSIMLFHCTLNAIVDEVRNGNEDSFFKAVRIDHSIITCPTFALRISRAELKKDKAFFHHLRSALKGPSKKHWESYKDLRYALCILRESGFDQMSDEELENLLVHQLKLYPNNPGARKNLRKHFTASKKFSTT